MSRIKYASKLAKAMHEHAVSRGEKPIEVTLDMRGANNEVYDFLRELDRFEKYSRTVEIRTY